MHMLAFEDLDVCRGILESLPTGMCVVDLQKRIVYWSDGAERITGYLRHEVIGHSCVAEPVLHCDQPGCEFCSNDCPVAVAMKTSRAADSSGFLHHKGGHEIPVRIRAVPVRNAHGSIIGALETFEDLHEAVIPAPGEPARHVPDFIDGVTGVANRAMMQSHLRQALRGFEDAKVSFGVLLLQVEGLAHFRASLGAEAATALLRVVARTLESNLWITDFVGRWSEDQFLVIVGGCGVEGLGNVRERIRRTLAGEGIEWWGERRSLPVSIGEAVPQVDDDAEKLVKRAEKALETASGWRAGGAAAEAGASGS